MAMIDDCKKLLRITSTAYDDEIDGLIDYAEASLAEAGILTTTSDLAKTYIKTVVKALFGWNNPDAKDLREVAEQQLIRMSLLQDHITTTE